MRNCPYCNRECECEEVDNGVGLEQCGPHHCDYCICSEIPWWKDRNLLSEIEQKTGWYKPRELKNS